MNQRFIGQSQERPGVTGRDGAAFGHLPHLRGQLQQPGAAPKPRSRRDAFYDEVELALKETLGRKVRVVPGRGKGTLEIEFYSNEDLKDLANKLGE